MDVASETGHPGVGPTAVASKQAGLLPIQGEGPAADQALPLAPAAAPRLGPPRPRRRHQGAAGGDSPLRGGAGQAACAAPPAGGTDRGGKTFCGVGRFVGKSSAAGAQELRMDSRRYVAAHGPAQLPAQAGAADNGPGPTPGATHSCVATERPRLPRPPGGPRRHGPPGGRQGQGGVGTPPCLAQGG